MGQKIYVGNLSFSVTNQDLQTKFEQYGNVDSAKVIMDRDSGRSKGFAFIEMADAQEAADAISALNGSDFQGRTMTVNEAKPMEPREKKPFSKFR